MKGQWLWEFIYLVLYFSPWYIFILKKICIWLKGDGITCLWIIHAYVSMHCVVWGLSQASSSLALAFSVLQTWRPSLAWSRWIPTADPKTGKLPELTWQRKVKAPLFICAKCALVQVGDSQEWLTIVWSCVSFGFLKGVLNTPISHMGKVETCEAFIELLPCSKFCVPGILFGFSLIFSL